MMSKRLRPSIFATVVVAPIAALQLIFVLVGVWADGTSLIGAFLIDALFWLIIYWIWRLTARRPPPDAAGSVPRR